MNSHQFKSPISKLLGLIGIVFLLISCLGFIKDTQKTFQSYLFSFLFWSDLPLGALPLVMIYHLTGGSWGASSRKILEALSDLTLTIFLFFIPIIFGLNFIYPWTNPEIASSPKIQHKHFYLNSTSFCIRSIFYFLCWLLLNRAIQRFSKVEESVPSIEDKVKAKNISAGGLVLLAMLSTFASIDWQMSVEPKWYSTIYGMIFCIGQSLSSFSFCLVAFGFFSKQEKLENFFPKKTLRDLGNILLTLIMVWAYLSFMQYLIIWSGNLPHEVIWFNHRIQGGWVWLILMVFLFQFSAPFILLLFRASKDSPTRLAFLGGLVFLFRVIDHYWMLMPGLMPDHFVLTWQSISTWLGLGGICLSVFLRKMNCTAFFAKDDLDWPKMDETEPLKSYEVSSHA